MSESFDARVQATQHRLAAQLSAEYDFIVCGAGSAGCVVARRLAENTEVSVLLLEAGSSDDLPNIQDPRSWPLLRRSRQNWMFRATPNPRLNGRSIPMAMGKVLGGGSSINVMAWSRGHRQDWDDFAAEAGDDAWNYQSVLRLYRRIESWRGAPDAERRGTDGPLIIQPAPDPHPLAAATLEAFALAGVPIFEDQNGAMMEGEGGAAITNVCIWEDRRQSVFRAYVHPYMDRSNLTVLTEAEVARLTFRGKVVTGVEFVRDNKLHRVAATVEVVLCLGAIHTPKVLMHSGIGEQLELARFRIPTIEHLPGVGRNFQDHVMAPCVWEAWETVEGRNNLGEATAVWKSNPALATPNLQSFLSEFPYASPEASGEALPAQAWSLTTAVLRPASRGRVRLTGSEPRDPVEIDANFLEDPADLDTLKNCIEFCRMVGNSAPLQRFAKREVLPGSVDGNSLETFARNGAVSHSHQSCTAKMGRDRMSVVNAHLQVYGIDRLRIADASILPRITTGNIIAPCVVIGERAGEILKAAHRL